jgi:hypothetical protein
MVTILVDARFLGVRFLRSSADRRERLCSGAQVVRWAW